jgi:hypothetical protein
MNRKRRQAATSADEIRYELMLVQEGPRIDLDRTKDMNAGGAMLLKSGLVPLPEDCEEQL